MRRLRLAIADEAKPGERLPPAKDLAAVLGVNTNTVLRAAAAASPSPAHPSKAPSSNNQKSSSTHGYDPRLPIA